MESIPSTFQWAGFDDSDDSCHNALFLFSASKYLHFENSRLFSFARLFGLLGVHKAKLYLYQDKCSVLELGFDFGEIKVLDDN
jgi:hypothetical protein